MPKRKAIQDLSKRIHKLSREDLERIALSLSKEVAVLKDKLSKIPVIKTPLRSDTSTEKSTAKDAAKTIVETLKK